MTENTYNNIFTKLQQNLNGFLYNLDQSYIDNLVKNIGRTEKDARSLAAWDWTHGIGLYGIYKLYEATGSGKYLDALEKWFENRMEVGLPDKNVNTVCPLLSMAFLHEIRPDERYRAIMDEWAEWIMNDMMRTEEGGIQHTHAELLNNQEMWDDTLFMTVLFLAKYGKMTGNQAYTEEAKYQFLVHVKYLFDPATGLWFHGWNFITRDHFAGALWGRGNCWITVFIPDFIDILGLTGAIKKMALGVLYEQVRALRSFQDESGMWHTLINDESSYLEASATAGFCYGILKGIRLGYLDESFRECGERSLKAVVANISGDGELLNVSYGTNVGRTLEHYKEIPLRKMHYGQALATLAMIEGFKYLGYKIV